MHERQSDRVLVVGCDGADWGLVLSLIEAGSLPNFQRLVNTGVMGYVQTHEPHFPGTLWTTLATGQRPDRHRILGHVEPSRDRDRLVPVDGRGRRCPAIWNMAAACGLRSHVVAWPAAPIESTGGVFVAEHVVRAWRGGAAPEQRHSGILPASARPALDELFIEAADFTAAELLPFVPLADQIDQAQDRRLAFLAGVMADTVNTHSAATWALEHEPWDLALVHYDLIDRLSHAFMAFHPPRPEHVLEREFSLYQHVVSQAYTFFDAMLGRLVELAGENATVIVVSPHGFAHGQHRPYQSSPRRSRFDWHRPFGMWLARGPALRSDEWMWGAESIDLAPTLLMLLGLPVANDLDGQALVRMLRQPVSPQRIPSWNSRAAPGPFAEASPGDERMGMRRLCEDGFLEPSEISSPDAVEHAQDDNDFALARVYAETARPADACRILEPLCRRRGDVEAWLLMLARVYQDLGDLPACRRLVAQSLAGGVSRLQRALVECTLLCGERRFADALDTLLDVEQSHPDHAGLHCHIGDVYLDLQRWDDAARAYRRSLKIEPASSRAFLGLTIAALASENYEQAIDLARSAIRLTYHLPMAHYHLGVAFSKCGRSADAARSFETCLEQRPNTPEAHAWLAHIYFSSLSDPEKARRHQSMAVGPKSKH